MEAQIGRKSPNLCVGGTSGGTEKRSLDWNLYDYRWDSNLFVARAINPSPSNCAHRQFFNSQERNFELVPSESSESEKRRRISAWNEEELEAQDEEIGFIDHNKANEGGNLSCSICQVDGCGADLSGEKDYHRRHKVCPHHSKAPMVSIEGHLRRFCQQCSKFHVLEEFDEGKRSCRRRLDRHNGRRRKKNNQNAADGAFSLNGNEASAIIITLLKIISNLELARPDPQNDQQILINLLSSLAGVASSSLSLNISELLQRLQNPPNAPVSNLNVTGLPSSSNARDDDAVSNSLAKGGGVRDFDLNDVYFEQENQTENENEFCGNGSPDLAQPSGKTPCGEIQSRTGKIVFKLFGKEPSDSPPNLRPEILTWLSNCPSEMESYIKPGCIVLTLYLRLADSKWQELESNLAYWIERLIRIANRDFWSTGWVYATLEDQVVFMYNGRIILEGPLLFKDPYQFKILRVTPLAVPSSSNVTFSVKGLNLSKSNARLFCVYEGEYLIQEAVRDLVEEGSGTVQGGPECLTFSCSVPASTGRGFLEIEEYDHSGFFFPFIVTDEASCIEIRTLESETDQNKVTDFLQEMGWLLKRAHIRSNAAIYSTAFPVVRYKHLMSFAMNREWCAVLKKLLDLIFNGDVQLDGCTAEEFVLGENLLFEAVRRKSRYLVAFLLRYKIQDEDMSERYLFRPDMKPYGTGDTLFVTPLHLAATMDLAECVLDALTDDPRKIGIKAWVSCRGNNQTPKECAEERGHESYVNLVQGKIDSNSKKMNIASNLPVGHFDIEKGYYTQCTLCMKKPLSRSTVNRFSQQRPAVMMILCVAAVCVCVSLILKTPPYVRYTTPPFLWDSLQGGSM